MNLFFKYSTKLFFKKLKYINNKKVINKHFLTKKNCLVKYLELINIYEIV